MQEHLLSFTGKHSRHGRSEDWGQIFHPEKPPQKIYYSEEVFPEQRLAGGNGASGGGSAII